MKVRQVMSAVLSLILTVAGILFYLAVLTNGRFW